MQFLESALEDAETSPRLVTTPTAGEIALFLSLSNKVSAIRKIKHDIFFLFAAGCKQRAQYTVVLDICIYVCVLLTVIGASG